MPVTHYRKGRENGPSDLFIATPSGSGSPSGNYQMGIADTFKRLGELGLKADYALHVGDCHVDDARNHLVRHFLMSEAPVMLFIDDDVGWNASNLVKIINYDADIVVGAYPLKQDREEYPVRVLPTPVQQARADGLLEVEGAPTGFMAIKRHVLVAIEEKKKWTRFRGRGFPKNEPPHTIIFERTLRDNHRWSGDYNFCREVRAMGFKVWVDPEMNFTHEGRKVWEGSFGNWLRRVNNIPEPTFIEGFNRLASGEATKEVFEQIFVANANPYSAGPSMIQRCYEDALVGGRQILEIGSGLTTIAMGMAAIRSGATIWTLEHDFDYWRQTRDLIKRYGLKAIRLCHAPLKELADGSAWYDPPSEAFDRDYSLVVCDGPPRRYGRQGLHILFADQIRHATWIVDDVDDKRQLDLVKEKAAERGSIVEVIGNPNMRQYAVVKAA